MGSGAITTPIPNCVCVINIHIMISGTERGETVKGYDQIWRKMGNLSGAKHKTRPYKSKLQIVCEKSWWKYQPPLSYPRSYRDMGKGIKHKGLTWIMGLWGLPGLEQIPHGMPTSWQFPRIVPSAQSTPKSLRMGWVMLAANKSCKDDITRSCWWKLSAHGE